jgi:hypothetical protein
MTEPSAGPAVELPEVAEQALTAEPRELVEALLDQNLDADTIARRLLANADYDQPD